MKRRLVAPLGVRPPCGCGDGQFAVSRAAFGMSWESKLVEPKPAHVEIRNLEVTNNVRNEVRSVAIPAVETGVHPARRTQQSRGPLPVGGTLEPTDRGHGAELHPGRDCVFARGGTSRGHFVGNRYRG